MLWREMCCFVFSHIYNTNLSDLLIMIRKKNTRRRKRSRKARNIGEQDELLAVLTLIFQKTSGNSIPGFPVITSVQTPEGQICKDWQLGLQKPESLKTLSMREIKRIACKHGFHKSPGRFKADILINGEGVSLKSKRGSAAAIVNTTKRNGWEQACRYMNVNIAPLDEAIDAYWVGQFAGKTGEDVANNHPDSPFKDRRHLLAPMLEYFLFYGSGSGESKVKASKIAEFDDPSDISTWSILTPADAVYKIWDRLVFSIRGKGMPKNFPQMRLQDAHNKVSIERWTKKWEGKYRGALHVRA